MSDQFLSNFSKLPKTIQPVSTTAQYGNTLPTLECPGGIPRNKYANYGENPLEVMYSIWNAYQSTIGAQFTQSQSDIGAPTSPENTIIGPKNIFIIRHAEKFKSTATNVQYHLDEDGVYRACQIPTFINKLATMGYPISYMITSNPCALNLANTSMRNEQTIAMASFLLNIPMFIYGGITDTQAVADALFDPSPTNPFNGLNVLICWEHTTTQDLCLNLIDTSLSVGRSAQNADDFFAQPSVSQQICVDGTYLAPSGEAPFTTDPTNTASAFYPFWNANNYDNIFCFLGNTTNTNFDFTLSNQQYFNCLTCYPSCELKIGLYQPPSVCSAKTTYYLPGSTQLETECLPPNGWAYPSP